MDVPILKYIDVLIGLAFIMVLGCTVVAAATQVVTSWLYLRAQYLRQGLADLLQQLDPSASAADCQYAAQLIQRHPLVCRPATLPGGWATTLRRIFFKNSTLLPSGAPADTVQRHEFVRILLEWAAGEGVLGNLGGSATSRAQRDRLDRIAENIRAVLAQNRVTSPSATLSAIQHFAVAQEHAYPQRPAHLWQTAALLQACPAEFVGKITGWYDGMSARTSERFGLQSKIIGGAVAGLLVFLLPLDSIEVVRRLADNPQARAQIVEMAERHLNSVEAAGSKVQPADLKKAQDELNAAKLNLDSALAPLNLTPAPASWPGWTGLPGAMRDRIAALDARQVPGIILSWVLLSLGAPFWYDLLKNLFKLRSVVAQKDDKERNERESALETPAVAGATPAAGAAAASGVIAASAVPVTDDEAGDLQQMAAVG